MHALSTSLLCVCVCVLQVRLQRLETNQAISYLKTQPHSVTGQVKSVKPRYNNDAAQDEEESYVGLENLPPSNQLRASGSDQAPNQGRKSQLNNASVRASVGRVSKHSHRHTSSHLNHRNHKPPQPPHNPARSRLQVIGVKGTVNPRPVPSGPTATSHRSHVQEGSLSEHNPIEQQHGGAGTTENTRGQCEEHQHHGQDREEICSPCPLCECLREGGSAQQVMGDLNQIKHSLNKLCQYTSLPAQQLDEGPVEPVSDSSEPNEHSKHNEEDRGEEVHEHASAKPVQLNDLGQQSRTDPKAEIARFIEKEVKRLVSQVCVYNICMKTYCFLSSFLSI